MRTQLDIQKNKKLNICFTSIGRRVELVHAFQKAYASLELGGSIIGIDKDPLAAAFRSVNRKHVVPPLTSPDYISHLSAICRHEEVDVLFPLIDPDIPNLAEHRAILEESGVRVLVVSPDAARITADKYLTEIFFRDLDLKTPRTWRPDQINIRDIPYPVFIKPAAGSAGKDAQRISTPEELSFFMTYITNPMIQEYIPGPEITTDITCDIDGKVLGMVSRKRIEVRWGEVAKGVTVFNPAIQNACLKIAEKLPAVGPITVQCIMKGEEPFFTEINARFGGGLPLGIAAGVDSPKLLLARLANLPVEIPPLGAYRINLYMTRYDESFFLTESDCEEIPRHHF